MTPARRLRIVRDATGRPHLHDLSKKKPKWVAETRASEPAPQAQDPRPLNERLAPPYGVAG